MSRTPKKRGARLRVALAVGTAAMAASAFGASSASAATYTLDHAFLKVSGLEAPQEVITPANAITWTTVDGGGGAFTVANNPDTNEIQTLSSAATSGNFTLSFDNLGAEPAQTTDAIAFNATAATIKTRLSEVPQMSTLGAFGVKVSGGPLNTTPVVIEFVGGNPSVYGTNQNPLVVTDSTVGGPPTIVETQAGSDKSDFDFPQFVGSASGVPLAVDLVPLGPVAGNFNTATGVLTTATQNYSAQIALGSPVNADCTVTPIPLDFSTAKSEVFVGNAFDAGPVPVNGAIVDGWSSLPGDPAPACGLINGLTAGSGALWMSNGIATPELVPPPVVTPPPATPAPKKCKKGQKLKKGKCVKKKKKKKK